LHHRAVAGVADVLEAAEDLADADAHFHAREVRAEAEVAADAEGEVRRIAVDPELVRVVVDLYIRRQVEALYESLAADWAKA